jgi:hypothetical protein
LIKKAKGEFAIYIDADMLLTKSLISCCVSKMMNSSAIALYIPEVVLGRSLFAKVRTFERSFYDATAIDAVRFFRRSTFIEVGGFDENLFRSGSGEDWDLDLSLSKKGQLELLETEVSTSDIHGFANKFASEKGHKNRKFVGIFHNESEDKLVPYLQKKRYYATGFEGYRAKWSSETPIIKKQFGIRYRLVTVFIENGKWKKCIRRFDLYLLTLCLKVLVGLVSVDKL